jgi:signal transduction histidine kinase
MDTATHTGRWGASWRKWSGPRARDVVIVVLCAINTAVQAVMTFQDSGLTQMWLVIVLGIVATVAMWWRRRYPLAVGGIATATYLISQVLLPVGFSLLTIAVRRRDRVLVAATVIVALCLMVPGPTSTQPFFDVATMVAGVVGALIWALWGAYVGARRDLVTSLRDRASRAEEERELRAEQARLAERARIAREMHDVLAHKVSLIALQAGGLEVNPGVGTEQVQQTAGLIRATAREALQDLRGVLGVLREQPVAATDGSDLAPQPGLSQVAALVSASRLAGVQVTLTNEVTDLPNTLGRTIFRVVQESLTNVHKHARGAATEIVISPGVANGVPGVGVSVSNRRPVAAGSLLPGSGAGLIGLRERVELVGGTLRAGPTSDGGWRVDAWLPDSLALIGGPS